MSIEEATAEAGRRIRPVSVPGIGRLGFRQKVWLAWACMLAILACGFFALGLDLALIRQKLPFLLGLRLTADGFLQGAALTVFITAISMVLALIVAILAALGRLSTNPLAFAAATFYASLFRGTPLLVQVLIIYLALPQLGIVLSALTSGVMALALNYGAYLAEIIRSGIAAIPRGQTEAAMALGLRRWQIGIKIVAPQAMRIIIPPAGTQFVSMLKDSSLVSLMGLWELNFLAQSYGRSTFHYMEMLTAAAAIYWLLSIGLELVQYRLELKFGRASATARP
ncbi:amino acid ABC transporter permease [Labrys sp. La1]|uniref:amino acid ABC transporter permease n=1 Tax=Labrys sp. La1 TaxID=3404917 RepID=UPI003EBEF2B9